MFRSKEDQVVAELEEEFGDWEIWYVTHVFSSTTWHARQLDDDGSELEREDPEELAEAMREVEEEQEQEQEQQGWWAR
jgi:hypothetical protein